METNPHHRRILAAHQRFAHRDFTLVFIVSPLHSPLAKDAGRTADPDQTVVERPVLHHITRKDPFLESRRIKKRRERRPHRPPPLHAAVVFAVAEIPPAHHHEDRPGLVVQSQHRALQVSRRHRIRIAGLRRVGLETPLEFRVGLVGIARAVLDFLQAPPQSRLRRLLHLGIDRRVNIEAAVHGPVEAERGNRLLADVVQGVRLADRIRTIPHDQRFGHRLAVSLAGEKTLVVHLLEHVITAGLGGFEIGPGRQGIRTLQQPGQSGRLSRRQVERRHPEIPPRRRLRPVKSAAEIHAVQIHLHDLLFAELLLDAVSQRHLEQLAAVSPFLEVERIARQLLRHRARALPDAARRPVGLRRTQHAHEINPLVFPKTLILRGHHSLHQGLRDLLVVDRIAVLDENFSHQLPLAIVNLRGRLHARHAVEIELARHFRELSPHRKNHHRGDQTRRHQQEQRQQKQPPPPPALLARRRIAFLPGIIFARHKSCIFPHPERAGNANAIPSGRFWTCTLHHGTLLATHGT